MGVATEGCGHQWDVGGAEWEWPDYRSGSYALR